MEYNQWIYLSVAIALIYYLIISKNSNRKIISVYNENSHFGMGDYIRGLIHLYQNEDENKIFVNYKHHPISQFIENKNGNNACDKMLCKTIYKTNEKNYNDFKKFDKTLCLHHNAMPCYPINEHILKKVRNIITPTKELNDKVNLAMEKIGILPKQFAIVHIRLNDSNQRSSSMYMSDKLESLLKTLQSVSNNKMPIVIMSNSMITKQSVANHFGFKMIDIIPTHTAGKIFDATNEESEIIGTLIEFYVMSHAKQIYQHNESKNFESGFSKRISELYSIPLIKI